MSRIKTAAHWTFENFFPALFWAGLSVNVLLLTLEKELDAHSCVKEDNNVFKDAAKQIFFAMFLVRLVALPLIAKLIKTKCAHPPDKEHVKRLEVEFNDGIETAVFATETIKSFGLPYGFAIGLSVPAVWPVFCALYKFYNVHFERGDRNEYFDFTSPKVLAHVFTLSECLYNALSLSSAVSFVLDLLFNVFYNTTHEEEFPYKDFVTWPLIALFAFLGGASVLSARTLKLMSYSEAFVNTFYYAFNISISTVSCTRPDLFTTSGYKSQGWKYVAALAIASGISAIIGGFHGVEDVYKPEKRESYASLDEGVDGEPKAQRGRWSRLFGGSAGGGDTLPLVARGAAQATLSTTGSSF